KAVAHALDDMYDVGKLVFGQKDVAEHHHAGVGGKAQLFQMPAVVDLAHALFDIIEARTVELGGVGRVHQPVDHILGVLGIHEAVQLTRGHVGNAQADPLLDEGPVGVKHALETVDVCDGPQIALPAQQIQHL